MTTTLFSNANILDVFNGAILADRHVLVEDGHIREISESPITGHDLRKIDVAGRVLMPGLCDAHVHVTAGTADFALLARWSPFYAAGHASQILHGMLMRGFTTVRDAGGADWGLARAVEEDLIVGSRILYCGTALSQTGGHGDMRTPGEEAFDTCFCCAGLGRICDGVSEMRRAARDEIRKGANQVKLMVSGGVASPTDRISSTQFSIEEIRAAVEEAEAAEIYVMAHAYTARAINRAIQCGVRSIEHGNLLDEGSIELFNSHGTYLVPTLSAYRNLVTEGEKAGMPAHLVAKVYEVLDAGMVALELAHRGGVKMAYGTDLLGIMHRNQSMEFAIRTEVQPSLDVVQAATCNAAGLFGMEAEIGQVSVGARADLIVVERNPLDDITVLQGQGEGIPVVMKNGRIYKDALA